MTRLRFSIALNPSKAEAGDLSSYGNVTFAPMEALADGLGGLDMSLEKPADELAAGNYSYFAEGDLLIAKVTPCFENGKKALVARLPNRIGFATSEVHVVRPDKTKVDPDYLRYVLSSETFRAAGIASMTGAGGLRRITDSAIKDFLLPLSDLEVQKAVASYLDRETSRINRLIAIKERQVELLLEKQQIALDALTFRSPQAHRWQRVPFKWVCRIPSGQVDPTISPWVDLPLIAPNHIESKTGRLLNVETAKDQAAESGKYVFPEGTVLYSKIRPSLGKACISPFSGLCSADMYPILPSSRLLPSFLLMQLLSRTFTSWATVESMRVAMPKINREAIGTFQLLLPLREAQVEAVQSWTKSRSEFEAARAAIKKSIELLREHRSALITATVTGQIDVHGKAATVTPRADRAKFRIIVGAEIVHRHQGNARFGRIKEQKLLYLAEAHVGINELGGNYLRYAAGPFDAALINETERGMEAAGFYRAQAADDGPAIIYVPLANAGRHTTDLKAMLGPRSERLRALISLLRDKDKDATEAIATLYAVWNDALMDGEQPNDEAIIKGFLTDWHAAKGKFREADLRLWLAWMKRNGLVPRGQGPRTTRTMTPDLFS